MGCDTARRSRTAAALGVLTWSLRGVRQVVGGRFLRAGNGCRREDLLEAASSSGSSNFSLELEGNAK